MGPSSDFLYQTSAIGHQPFPDFATLLRPPVVWSNVTPLAKIEPDRPAASFGDVAQSGERLVCNQEVAGSTPVVSTGLDKDLRRL